MRKLILICLIILTSCTTLYKIETKCSIQKSDFLSKISSKLVDNGFSIIASDANIGYIRGFKSDNSNWWWELYFNEGNITAYCFTAWKYENNHIGYDDKTRLELYEYWKIRNYLDTLCPGVKVTKVE